MAEARVPGVLLLAACALPLYANEAEVVAARALAEGSGKYRFEVTLRHADSGWEHYANAWEVVGENGRVLGRRVLYHPHVDEQPFTRSLSGVSLPPGTKRVLIRAFDSVHGQSGRELAVTIPAGD